MKASIKFLFIAVMISSCVTGSQIVSGNKIYKGMSKLQFSNQFLFASIGEHPMLNENDSSSRYFSKTRSEIIWANDSNLFYVFKNVSTPVKCGFWMCNYGNGNFDSYFYTYKDAVDYLDPQKTTKEIEQKPLVVTSSLEIEKVNKLEELIEEFESGNIDQEEFNRKKKEIIDE
tara:strand:+ start:102 stop:620 length:519 start_codon:yes stop_codon:yes gene_type:complete